MKETVLNISSSGVIQFVYDDLMLPLLDGGSAQVRRVSNVEPDPYGGWFADLSSVRGPLLSGYKRRDEAIAAEVAYLNGELGKGRVL